MMRNRFAAVTVIVLGMATLLGFDGCGRHRTLPVTTTSEKALTLFEQGRELMENYSLDKASVLIDKALEIDPKFAMAWAYHSLLFNDPAKIEVDLGKAEKYSKTKGERQFVEAFKALYIQHNHTLYIDRLKKLISEYPGDKHLRLRLAVFLLNYDMDRTFAELKKTIEIDPNFPPAYNILGYVYSTRGNFAEAKKYFAKYIELNPTMPNPYDSMGDVYTLQGNFEKAVKYYRKALERDSSFADSRMKIGIDLVWAGKLKEARREIEDYIASTKTPVDRFRGYETLARIDNYAEDTPAALKALETCVEIGREAKMWPLESEAQGSISALLIHKRLSGAKASLRKQAEVVQGKTFKPMDYENAIHQLKLLEGFYYAVNHEFEKADSINSYFAGEVARLKQASDAAPGAGVSSIQHSSPVGTYQIQIAMLGPHNPFTATTEADKVYTELIETRTLHTIVSGLIEFYSDHPEKAIEILKELPERQEFSRYLIALAAEKLGDTELERSTLEALVKWNHDTYAYSLVRPSAEKRLRELENTVAGAKR